MPYNGVAFFGFIIVCGNYFVFKFSYMYMYILYNSTIHIYSYLITFRLDYYYL